MHYTTTYNSPLGNLLIAANETKLIGLWIEGQKSFAHNLAKDNISKSLPVFDDTKNWLDIYFSGKAPDFMPEIHLIGTPFQISVWEILKNIPYGKIITYKEISMKIAEQRGIKKMSTQAVGNAVGRNPISIIIPCHRVIGSNRSLTGYAGGIDKKAQLLALEGIELSI